MNELNNLLHEYIFKIPIDNNIDIFQTIENTLNELNNNILNSTFQTTNDDYIQFNIKFDYTNNDIFDDDDDEIFNYDTQNENTIFYDDDEDDDIQYQFKTCNDINNKLCKSEKIKKNDNILSEYCFICMDNYNEKQFKRVLPMCKHYFHKKCIDKWIKKNPSCPICRDKLLK
jgi:Ring finger domain